MSCVAPHARQMVKMIIAILSPITTFVWAIHEAKVAAQVAFIEPLRKYYIIFTVVWQLLFFAVMSTTSYLNVLAIYLAGSSLAYCLAYRKAMRQKSI